MALTVQQEIERATVFGEQLEDAIVKRESLIPGEAIDRDRLLLAYWALAFDYDKSILALVRSGFYGGAFALLRPLVEALVRAHVVLMGSNEVVDKIKNDTYTVNFKTIGAEIDTAFNLAGFFDRFLSGSRGALHSFTHSGLSQLGRRFKGDDLDAHYEDDEITELIYTSSTSVWMVTNLLTNQFKLVEEKEKINKLFLEREGLDLYQICTNETKCRQSSLTSPHVKLLKRKGSRLLATPVISSKGWRATNCTTPELLEKCTRNPLTCSCR